MRGLVLRSAAIVFMATIFNACEEEDAIVNVTAVKVNPEEVSTSVGEEVQFTATLEPEGATDTRVSWSTSDASIATIDAEGKLTALTPGVVEVTAISKDGEFTSSVSTAVNATLLGTSWTIDSEVKSECTNPEENETEKCQVECRVIEFKNDGTISFSANSGPEGVINYTNTASEITVSYEDNGEQVTEVIPYTIEIDALVLSFAADEGGCKRTEVYTTE